MKYSNTQYSIEQLIEMINHKSIDLHPSYQRNFIWSPKDQRLLIDSILKGYPLPSFFLFKTSDNNYEMLDGQQRAITIFKYYKNEISDSQKRYFKDLPNPNLYMEYKLNIIEVGEFNESKGENKEELFYLVNKRGIHLNPAEVNHAYYHDSDFLNLVNKIMDLQALIDLDIFTDKTKIRMNDRGLIEEIVAYLFKGITDKRAAVEDLFQQIIPAEKSNEVYHCFEKTINRIYVLNQIKPINETRYKQKNDFYTLFCFVNEHIDIPIDILKLQYNILVFISDQEYIYPSNYDCGAFREYALNCVSQSNSKTARENRLKFFNDLLCNMTEEGNAIFNEVVSFLQEEFSSHVKTIKCDNYILIDVNHLCY